MKRLRSFLGLAMIGALLALLAHGHDDADSANQCAASAWHCAALDCAVLKTDLPSPAPQSIFSPVPSTLLLSGSKPHCALPRAPPSPNH